MKTTWNLELLYSSASDPQIEKDLAAYERACKIFEKKYRAKTDYLENETKLKEALEEYEKLYGMAEPRKAYDYFHLRKDVDSRDQEAERQLNMISDRITRLGNLVIFFELALGKISSKLQEQFLKSNVLKPYHYFLKRVFLTAAHQLTEPEEKILNLKSLPSQSMWVQGQEKILNQQVVKFAGKTLPLPAAQNLISQLPTQTRRKLSDETNKILKNISHFAESEINAVYTDKKIDDELRGFKYPYSATALAYHNDEKSISNFIETVTKRADISHRFYALKAKLLKQSKLFYADRAAKVGSVSIRPTFDQSLSFLRSAFEKADPHFREILDEYIEGGHIDVYPKKGKKAERIAWVISVFQHLFCSIILILWTHIRHLPTKSVTAFIMN